MMNHLRLTFIGLLALTAAASDGAFGQFGPPMGVPPRPPTGGLPRPPMGGGSLGPFIGGPVRGGDNFSGNISRGTVNSGGNINANRAILNSGGNLIAKDSGNVTVNSSGDIKLSRGGAGYYGRGYYSRGCCGRGYHGHGDYDYERYWRRYGRGAYYWGGYATGVVTGAAAATSTSGRMYYYPYTYQPGAYTDTSRAADSGSSRAISSGSYGGTNSAAYHQRRSSSSVASGTGGSTKGGVAGGAPSLNPLIADLFASLPPDGATWTLEGALDWLQAAAANLRIVYRIQGTISVMSGTGPSDGSSGYGGN